MSPFEIAGLTIFILVLFAGIFSTIFGFPGTIVIFFDVIFYAFITGFERIGLKILLILAILSVLAELIDFALGMAGAIRFSLSKKSFWASVVGAIIGTILMTPSLLGVGVIMGILTGGALGVIIVELLQRYKLKPAFRASYGAIMGRVTGIFVKGTLSIIMVIITLVNIYS